MLSSEYSGPLRVSPKTICYRPAVLFSMIATIILIISFPAAEGGCSKVRLPGLTPSFQGDGGARWLRERSGNCIWTLGSSHTTQTVPGLSGRKLAAQADCFCKLSITALHTPALRLDPTLLSIFVYTRNMCIMVDTCAPARVTGHAL